MWTDPVNMLIANRHMNVEIGTEAAQFPEKEYINGIFVAVWCRLTSRYGPLSIFIYWRRALYMRFLFVPSKGLYGWGGGGRNRAITFLYAPSFFVPQMALAYWLDAISQVPTPLPLALLMDAARFKIITHAAV